VASQYHSITPGTFDSTTSASVAAQTQFNAIVSTLGNLFTLMTAGTTAVKPVQIRYAIYTRNVYSGNAGGGALGDSDGDLAEIDSILHNYDSTYALDGTTVARTVTDAVYDGSTLVTSDTADFDPSDEGMTVAGQHIVPGTKIVQRVNSTTVILSVAPTGTGGSKVLMIGKL
jgi:hypothetical protein